MKLKLEKGKKQQERKTNLIKTRSRVSKRSKSFREFNFSCTSTRDEARVTDECFINIYCIIYYQKWVNFAEDKGKERNERNEPTARSTLSMMFGVLPRMTRVESLQAGELFLKIQTLVLPISSIVTSSQLPISSGFGLP